MSRKQLALILALMAAYAIVLFAGALSGRGALFFHDTSIDGIPLRTAAAEAVRAGHLPLWDARIGNGFPVMGETQAGVFYPPHILLFVGLPQYYANALLLALHLALAACFTALLCRGYGLSWAACATAGLIFGFSGWFVTHAMCIAMVEAAAWLPLVILCLELWLRRPRDLRYLAGAALALSMAGLCSYPQMFFYTVLAATLYLIVGAFRRPESGDVSGGFPRLPACALAAIAVPAVAVLLSSAQMLPTAALIADSNRSSMTVEKLRDMAMEPRHLAMLVHPYIFGSYAEGNYFGRDHQYEVCGFMGTIALLMGLVGAVYGRGRARAYSVVLVPLALAMALARQNPLYELFPGVPGFGYFREAGRYLLLVTLGAAVLAAFGLDAVRQHRRAAWLALGLSLAGLALSVAAPLALSAARPEAIEKIKRLAPEEMQDAAALQTKAAAKYEFFLQRLSPSDPTYLMLVICLAGIAVACTVQLRAGSRDRHVALVALALTVAQLYVFGRDYNPTIEPRYYLEPPSLEHYLDASSNPGVWLDDEWRISQRLPGDEAWASGDMSYHWNEREIMRPNRTVINGHTGVDAAYPLISGRLRSLLKLLSATLSENPPALGEPGIANPRQVLSALGGGLFVSWSPNTLPDLPVLKRFGPVTVRLNVPIAPRAYFAEGAIPCADPQAALSYLCSPEFRFSRPAVETAPGQFLDPTASSGEVVSFWDDFGHLRIRTSSSGPGLLVVRQVWDRHFRCTVDGRPAPILRANYVFRGVALGAGEHDVEMTFDAWDVRAGGAVSLVSFILVCLVFARATKRRDGS